MQGGGLVSLPDLSFTERLYTGILLRGAIATACGVWPEGSWTLGVVFSTEGKEPRLGSPLSPLDWNGGIRKDQVNWWFSCYGSHL